MTQNRRGKAADGIYTCSPQPSGTAPHLAAATPTPTSSALEVPHCTRQYFSQFSPKITAMSTFATDPASADNVERKKEVLERLEGNVAPDNLKIAHNLSFIVCRDTDNLCS